MCIITLSVLKQCRHELATIDFCKLAGCDVPKNLNEAAVESGEEPLPRIACTPSLGWTIYETPNAPVTCKSCKAWLAKNEKHTYGDMMEDIYGQKDEVAPEKSVKRSRGSVLYTSKGPALPGSPAARRKPN